MKRLHNKMVTGKSKKEMVDTSDVEGAEFSVEMKLVISNQILEDRKIRQQRILDDLEGEIDLLLKDLVSMSGLVEIEKTILQIFSTHQMSLPDRAKAVLVFLHEEMEKIKKELGLGEDREGEEEWEHHHFHVHNFASELIRVRSLFEEVAA